MRGTNQGGSLAGFIIIGVLLTLVLVGGLYGLSRYNAQRADDQVAADQQKRDEQRSDEKNDDKPAPAATDNKTTEGTKTDIPEERPTTVTTAPAPTQVPTAGTELPRTGPADAFLALVALSLVTFAAAHYVRSRA